MESPQVTIVVVPQERFSHTSPALESLYQNTHIPFSLVYIDGGSPAQTQKYLQTQAGKRGFTLIRSDSYLTSNKARNIGLNHVKTQYVVFVDNDVVFTPNWLEKLINCAEETSATVVCPLTCIDEPIDRQVYFAGGEARIVVEIKGEEAIRKVHEEHYFVSNPLEIISENLQRRQCEMAKFHCMLVRQNVFEEIGRLDEQLLNTKEYLDFCLNLAQVGGKIYCEPSSVVTYVAGGIKWSDLPFFCLRWSDEWESISLQHFRKKWNLSEPDRCFQKEEYFRNWRYQTLLSPFFGNLNLGKSNSWVENSLKILERSLNNYFIRNQKNNLISS